MNVPENLRYTKDHEWLRLEADGRATIGITDYAQGSLGDVTFVDLPKPGRKFAAGDTFGVVESVKAASDLFMPVAGEVVETNPALQSGPEKVNQDPYGEAWMIRIRPANAADLDGLLSADAYRGIVG